MPELPEIETIKNDLSPHVVGKVILNVTFPADPFMRILRRFSSPDTFVRGVRGTTIERIRRRAKYLIFDLHPSRTLAMHLGMSGQLLIRSKDSPLEPYLRAVFHLENKMHLRFHDPRKFGELFLKLPHPGNGPFVWETLGPEPLEKGFSLAYLAGKLRKAKRPVKNFLMDQKLIAGLGNIYTDECLFRAKILPTRRTDTLRNDEVRGLHRSIRSILRKAIERRGTTASDKRYRDGTGRMGEFQEILKVYQRRGSPCSCCGAVIQSTSLGGRTASFCPNCQK